MKVEVKDMSNLCALCVHDFATCPSMGITFGADLDPSVIGKDVDKVVRCVRHEECCCGPEFERCGEKAPKGSGFCTRLEGHRGDHIACGMARHKLERWSNET